MIEPLPLGFGCVALLEVSEDDRAPFNPPRVKVPPRRAWAKNGHYWEDCACLDCAGRRAGQIPSGYENRRKDDALA